MMMLKSNMACRHGIIELFDQMRETKIPMLVVSAGIKDNIDTIFQEMLRGISGPWIHKMSYEELQALYNFKVIANTFKYDLKPDPVSRRMEKTIADFDDRVLHCMNKREFVNEIHREELQPMMRKNVLVLGDLVTDIDMVDPNRHDQMLKVGFLNKMQNEHLFDYYMEQFDIVICRDGPLLPVNLIVDTIVSNSETTNADSLKQYTSLPQLSELCTLLLDKQ